MNLTSIWILKIFYHIKTPLLEDFNVGLIMIIFKMVKLVVGWAQRGWRHRISILGVWVKIRWLLLWDRLWLNWMMTRLFPVVRPRMTPLGVGPRPSFNHMLQICRRLRAMRARISWFSRIRALAWARTRTWTSQEGAQAPADLEQHLMPMTVTHPTTHAESLARRSFHN